MERNFFLSFFLNWWEWEKGSQCGDNNIKVGFVALNVSFTCTLICTSVSANHFRVPKCFIIENLNKFVFHFGKFIFTCCVGCPHSVHFSTTLYLIKIKFVSRIKQKSLRFDIFAILVIASGLWLLFLGIKKDRRNFLFDPYCWEYSSGRNMFIINLSKTKNKQTTPCNHLLNQVL